MRGSGYRLVSIVVAAGLDGLTRCPLMASAVSPITGTLRVTSSALTRRVACRPSITGRLGRASLVPVDALLPVHREHSLKGATIRRRRACRGSFRCLRSAEPCHHAALD